MFALCADLSMTRIMHVYVLKQMPWILFYRSKNFGIADAAHIAFSESFGSCFISCDDKMIKKCNNSEIRIDCMNPVMFCEMEKLK